MVPRYSPNLRSFDVTSLRRGHLAARLPILTHQDIVRLWRLRTVCQNLSRRLADSTESAPDVKTSFLAPSFLSSLSHPSFVSIYLTIGTSSASLLGRKPLAFGSYEIRERITLDAHCPVIPLEPKPATMGSDLGSIVL